MTDRYEYHPQLGRMLHEAGYPPLFSVPTWMIKESDHMAAIRRIQHTVDCHVPVGEVRDILLEMCAQELPSQCDAKEDQT